MSDGNVKTKQVMVVVVVVLDRGLSQSALYQLSRNLRSYTDTSSSVICQYWGWEIRLGSVQRPFSVYAERATVWHVGHVLY